MLLFPNAKINLGLHITAKQSNGYHSIETIFYPVPLTDALEVVVSSKTTLKLSGIKLESMPDDNLVMKAYQLMAKKYTIPPLDVFLKKAIPSGAGLGGGSSDAAFMLKMLNEISACSLSDNKLEKIAAAIGADCPFFIRNTPMLATGTGTILKPVDLSLKDFTLCIVKPPIDISTREAYAGITPKKPVFSLKELNAYPVSEWKKMLANDFEPGIFKKHPVIGELKEKLYAMGAEYAAMSGSGSAVFGLFRKTISPKFPDCFVWTGTLR